MKKLVKIVIALIYIVFVILYFILMTAFLIVPIGMWADDKEGKSLSGALEDWYLGRADD